MANQPYHLQLDQQSCVEVELDAQLPTRLLVAELVLAHGLSLQSADGQPIRYGLFEARNRWPIGAERTLAQAALAAGAELCLADEHAPWWEQGDEGGAPLPMPPAAGRTARKAVRQLMFAGAALVVALVGLFALRPAQGAPAALPASPNLAQPAARAPVVPTVTLAARQPTAPPAPTPALPTPDPAILAQQAYAQGLQAYESANWSVATALFEQIYALDSSYRDTRARLAASYYGWGMQLLGQGDLAGAQARFQDALRLEPEHAEAQAALLDTQRYAEAHAAAGRGELDAAITAYRGLLRDHGGSYADAAQALYTALVARAEQHIRVGRRAELRTAMALYQEAAQLEGLDASVAQAGLQRLRRLLPTPTPAARSFKAIPAASFVSSGNSGQFASCVTGRVTGRAGPIDGAVLEVNNGPHNRYSATSGGGGYYRVCGLGASTWSVVLFFVPGTPALASQPAAAIYVSGAGEQQAVVDFVQR